MRNSLYEGGWETGPASLYNKHDDLYIMYTFCMHVCLFVPFGFTLNADCGVSNKGSSQKSSVFLGIIPQ